MESKLLLRNALRGKMSRDCIAKGTRFSKQKTGSTRTSGKNFGKRETRLLVSSIFSSDPLTHSLCVRVFSFLNPSL